MHNSVDLNTYESLVHFNKKYWYPGWNSSEFLHLATMLAKIIELEVNIKICIYHSAVTDVTVRS